MDLLADRTRATTGYRHRGVLGPTALVVAGIIVGLAAGWLLFSGNSGAGGIGADVETLVQESIAAWDTGDGESLMALMTGDATHICPLGRFSAAEDGSGGIGAAVDRMAADDFEIVSGPILSRTQAPLDAVTVVRIGSPSGDVVGIAHYRIVEQDGVLLIAESLYTHL